MIRTLLLIICLSTLGQLSAQMLSRSGSPAPMDADLQLRRFPCGGTTVFEEAFNDTDLPTGWQIFDQDQAVPRDEILALTPVGGWQLIPDIKDPNGGNTILASPSWYENDTIASDDWLISPEIASLPGQTCLSWYAYSQDPSFGESYEVWVTTAGNTISDFLKNGTIIFSEDSEGGELDYNSIDLSDYAGQSIYLAFRHTSEDKFILALDDIRLAQVNEVDLAMFQINEIRAKANDLVAISGSFINRGLDTLSLDSAALELFYSIDGVDSPLYVFPTIFTLAPNDTLNFIHQSPWVPDENRLYDLKVWFSALSVDSFNFNDTIFIRQAIGPVTTNIDALSEQMDIYPNPTKDVLNVRFDQGMKEAELTLMNVGGQIVRKKAIRGNDQLSVQGLPNGIYYLQVRTYSGEMLTEKILID